MEDEKIPIAEIKKDLADRIIQVLDWIDENGDDSYSYIYNMLQETLAVIDTDLEG